jgi:hypothetical protein
MQRAGHYQWPSGQVEVFVSSLFLYSSFFEPGAYTFWLGKYFIEKEVRRETDLLFIIFHIQLKLRIHYYSYKYI